MVEEQRLYQVQTLEGTLADIIRAEHGDGEQDDDDDPPPGFYFPPDYVLMTWQEKRNHGILPEPGGLNDQDWRLVYHDWPLLTAIYNRMGELLYPSDGSEGEAYQPVQLPPTPKKLDQLLD